LPGAQKSPVISGDAAIAQLGARLLAFGAQVALAFLVPQPLSDLRHVLAGVTVLRDRHVAVVELLVAGVQGAREDRDLRARVVDVVLLLHLVPPRAQHVGESGADGGAASVADVQWARGIGGDVLHLHARASAAIAGGVALAGLGDRGGLGGHPTGREVEVEEARRRDLHLGDGLVRRELAAQYLGHLHGAHTCEALDAQREVR